MEMEDTQTPKERIVIKDEIVNLQQFYVDAYLENLPEIVSQRKEELVDKLMYFKENHIQHKYDKYGNDKPIVNQYLVSTYFFRSINEFGNISPEYNPENLSVVWGIYQYLIEQVNLEICPFTPSLTHFCQFAGISTDILKDYKSSKDKQMREIAQKIYDACYQGQMMSAQNGITKESSTIWRMKTENEVVERKTPNINVSIKESVDPKEVNARLDSILGFSSKTIEGEYETKK